MLLQVNHIIGLSLGNNLLFLLFIQPWVLQQPEERGQRSAIGFSSLPINTSSYHPSEKVIDPNI